MKKFSGKTEKKPSVSNKVNQAMLHTTGTAKTASAEDEFGFGKSAVSMSDQELSAYIASLKKK
jgi:hypothetical protein